MKRFRRRSRKEREKKVKKKRKKLKKKIKLVSLVLFLSFFWVGGREAGFDTNSDSHGGNTKKKQRGGVEEKK